MQIICFSLPLLPHPHSSEALDVCQGSKDVELHVQALLFTSETSLVLGSVILLALKPLARFLG